MLRFILCLVFSLVVISSAAYAEQAHLKTICNNPEYYNKQNLSADYVPGVDVHGKAVAPADLNNSTSPYIQNPVVIPIEVDLAQRFGLILPLGIELKPTVADLEIYQDGRIKYEGKELKQDIQSVCKNYHDHRKKNQSDQTEQHGHESRNPVLSSDKIEGQYPEDEPKRPKYNN